MSECVSHRLADILLAVTERLSTDFVVGERNLRGTRKLEKADSMKPSMTSGELLSTTMGHAGAVPRLG